MNIDDIKTSSNIKTLEHKCLTYDIFNNDIVKIYYVDKNIEDKSFITLFETQDYKIINNKFYNENFLIHNYYSSIISDGCTEDLCEKKYVFKIFDKKDFNIVKIKKVSDKEREYFYNNFDKITIDNKNIIEIFSEIDLEKPINKDFNKLSHTYIYLDYEKNIVVDNDKLQNNKFKDYDKIINFINDNETNIDLKNKYINDINKVKEATSKKFDLNNIYFTLFKKFLLECGNYEVSKKLKKIEITANEYEKFIEYLNNNKKNREQYETCKTKDNEDKNVSIADEHNNFIEYVNNVIDTEYNL